MFIPQILSFQALRAEDAGYSCSYSKNKDIDVCTMATPCRVDKSASIVPDNGRMLLQGRPTDETIPASHAGGWCGGMPMNTNRTYPNKVIDMFITLGHLHHLCVVFGITSDMATSMDLA